MNREKLERVVNRIHSLIEGLEELRSMQEPEENKCCGGCQGCSSAHGGTSDATGSTGSADSPDKCGSNVSRIKVKRGVAAIEALKVINGERQDTYGNPEDCFAAIAVFWSVYRNEHFSDIDVAVMMALLKVARMKNNGVKHRDNFVDAIGYLALAADMAEKSKLDNALSSAD